ncbi:F-box/LRR-repeat protein 3 isoform X2 [Aplysia californica]|uniref:F-box/LRR-repeat protein 3 isoform X2 n=1 Tax=Aplysia californica TaxID=6500 RepID=A0ABM0K137_APLCA|nr:F-box/LRR-repeat protein 3 isoform X2 [Aplysia californica]
MWDSLPEYMLAEIFAYLDVFDRSAVCNVCRSWKNAAKHPDVWNWITLTREHFESSKYGADVACIIFNNMKYCKALTLDLSVSEGLHVTEVASRFCKNLKHLKMMSMSPLRRFGTKFELFPRTFFTLFEKNFNLESIDLDNVALCYSTNHPLPIGPRHAKTLRKLRLINSMVTFSPSSLMYLVNLTELTMSPNFLHYSLIKHLSKHSLKRLNLVDRSNVLGHSETLSEFKWEEIASQKDFRVGYFIMKKMSFLAPSRKFLVSPGMPLCSVVYNNNSWLPYTALLKLLGPFSSTLEELVDFSLSKDGGWTDSGDELLMSLVKSFPHLRTLSLRVPISTGTLLLMVTLRENLINLPVREDMNACQR